MTVFLSSSPCIDGVAPATLNPQNHFLDLLRSKLPENPRCLFVASSPDDREATCHFGSEMFGAFAGAGIYFSGYEVLDRISEEFAAELVYDSDLIILAGGHVPTQNAFFQSIALKRLLAGYPGVVMGISAGTMNAADTVYAQPEADGESKPSFRRFYPGLGLTTINICPHYQEVIERNMTVDGHPIYPDLTAADSMGHTFHIFPDGTYLYQDEKESAIYGECWQMKDGIQTKLTENGGRIALR